jgi:hypothetical protein
MPKLKDLKLEPYSKELARRLLEAFPAYEPYLGRAEREEEGLLVYVLHLKIPSANPEISEPLEIVVDTDRIVLATWFTMGKDRRWDIDWVYYFGNPLPNPWEDDPIGLDRIVNWLRAFTGEEVVAHVGLRGGNVDSWGACALDQVANHHQNSDGVVVRSWRGTQNRGVLPHEDFTS